MAFDKKHYKEIKKFMDHQLRHRPVLSNCNCRVEWSKTFFPLITACAESQDFEGAKATRDSIIEFLNSFGANIPDDARLKIPEKYEAPTGGYHISYEDPRNPTGLGPFK